MSFTYDAFLSYTSTDRPWARRVRDDLVNRGRKIFFDQQNIRAGEEWEESLQDAIAQSRNT